MSTFNSTHLLMADPGVTLVAAALVLPLAVVTMLLAVASMVYLFTENEQRARRGKALTTLLIDCMHRMLRCRRGPQ